MSLSKETDWSKLALFQSRFVNNETPLDAATLNQVLDGILNNKDSVEEATNLINILEDKDVVVKRPKFTATIKNGTETLKDAYEIGTKLNIKYSVAFDPGEYKYGDKKNRSNSHCVQSYC